MRSRLRSIGGARGLLARARVSIAPGFVAALALSVALTATAAESYLLEPNVAVAGKTQEAWSRAWWEWAGSFEQRLSPIADATGERCGLKQGSKVWFLAGTYDTGRTIRTCTVPRGRHLFFPLVNYVVMPRGPSPVNCEQAALSAERLTDDPARLILEIDGQRYEDLAVHRLATPECFDIGARAEPPVRVYPTAANGYYVMLKPLPPGRHVINFGGILPSILQAVTYTLTVE